MKSPLSDMILSQAKYTEAEPVLQQGYEGMKQREATIPPRSRRHLIEAGERVVRFLRGDDPASEGPGMAGEDGPAGRPLTTKVARPPAGVRPCKSGNPVASRV